MIKESAIILDIDGTLVDDSHRLHLINESYDAYHSEMSGDSLNIFVKSITNNLAINYQAKIIVLTSRPSKWRRQTEKQLAKFNVLHHSLIMRGDKDLRTSPEFKGVVADSLLERYNIMAAIEDRDDVIDMFRKKQIFTIKPFGVIKQA